MRKSLKLHLGTPEVIYPDPQSPFVYRAEVNIRSWGGPVIEPIPLYPHAMEFCRHYGKWWFEDKSNRFGLVISVPEGKLRYRLDGRSVILSGNDVLIIPRGVSYFFETEDDAVYQKNVLYLMGMNVDDILETLGLRSMQPITLPTSDFLLNSFRAIYDLLSKKEPENMASAAGTAFSLLNYLSMNVKKNDAKPALLDMLKSRFSNNFSSRINLAGVAGEYGISAKTITRMFHTHVGMTPNQFRRSARNEMACRLLLTTELSIKEIADKLGYSSQFHFTNEFHRTNGVPPGVFRKKVAEGR